MYTHSTVSLSAKNVIVILGPTCVGKTACSITLAQKWGCEIVSADARQCYREISIGTAKPTNEERQGIPHHLIDFLSIKEHYSAGLFEKDALRIVQKRFQKHDAILLTGGSGLYIKAVCDGLAPMPNVDRNVYNELENIYKKRGLGTLLAELKKRDPHYYTRVDKANPRRVLRALAVCRTSNKPWSQLHRLPPVKRPFNIIKIGLQRNRDALRQRINERVEKMVQRGLIEEAKHLYPHRTYKALHTIGYRELFDSFEGKYPLNEAIEKIKTNTHRYLKRQLTWLRNEKNVQWFPPEATTAILNHVAAQIQPGTKRSNNVSGT